MCFLNDYSYTNYYYYVVQSPGALEYTDHFSAEEWALPTNEGPSYGTKQSDGEVPTILVFWVMQKTLALPLFPGLLRSKVVAPDRILSMGQTELNCFLTSKLCTYRNFVHMPN